MTPKHVELSASDYYGISLSSERASELAKELTGLFAAVSHLTTRTDFDDWPDEFLSALAVVSRLTVRAGK